MRLALLLFTLPLCAQTIITSVPQPDGAVADVTLGAHPRLWWNAAQQAAFADPDGAAGVGVNAALNTVAGQAIVARVKQVRTLGLEKLISGERAQAATLWWWMDRNAQFDDGASVLDWAKNAILTEINRMPGYLMDDPSIGGSVAPSVAFDFVADWLVAWADAYSRIQSEFTTEERLRLERIMLNGVAGTPGACTHRLSGAREAGTVAINGSSTTVVGTGTNFTSALIGKMIYVRTPILGAGGGNVWWATVVSVQSTTSMIVNWLVPPSPVLTDLWWWNIPDFDEAQNHCGIAHFASTHGNTPSAISKRDDTGRLTAPLTADAAPPPGGYEEVIAINKTDWNPLGYYPFFAKISGAYSSNETVLVKSASGSTLTVQRGIWTPTTTHATNAYVIAFTHNAVIRSDWALNNRGIGRVSAYINLGLAFADETTRAKDLARWAIGHWRDSQGYTDLKDYFTLLNHSAVNYGSLGRTNVHLGPLTLTLKNSMTPSWDQTGQWLKKGMGYFHLYWTTAWDPGLFLRYGIEAGGCGASTGIYYASSCFVAPNWLTYFYPSDPVTGYVWYHYKTRCSTCTSKLNVSGVSSDGGENFLKPAMLFAGYDTAPQTDYTAVLGTGWLDAYGDNGSPRGLGNFVSKQSWATTASQIWGLYPQQYGDKDESANGFSTYSLGKRGWLINHRSGGVDGTSTTPAYYWVDQQTVDFGPGYKGKSMPMYEAIQTVKGKTATDYLYARVDLLGTINPYHQPIRHYRHTAHLKAAGLADYFVVYDDVAKSNAERIRSMIHYPHNGGVGEGLTTLSATGTTVQSSNLTAKVISSNHIITSGTALRYDLSVARTSGTVLTVCPDASVSQPCRLRVGSTTYSYTSPATFSATGSGLYWLYVSSGGALAAAHEAGLTPNCTGISCSVGAGFPGTELVRLLPGTIANGTITVPSSAQCPGSFTRNSSTAPVEWGTCMGPSARTLWMDAGTTDAAEFVVVHRATDDLGEAERTTTLMSTLDASADSRWTGVQIGGTDPAFVAFAKAGTVAGVTRFTTTYTGTGRVLFGSLAQGQYDVVRASDSATILSNQDVGPDGALYFTAAAGTYSVNYLGTLPVEIVSTSPLPGAVVGNQYSYTFTATGGTAPYTWAITSGTLPAGLGPLTVGGVLSGTPDAAATANFTIQATDSAGNTASRAFSLTVSSDNTLQVITTNLADATQYAAYSQTIQATGGTLPYQWSSTLGCAGLSLSPSSGAVAGIPTVSGQCTFIATVTDAQQFQASRQFTINILPGTPPPTSDITAQVEPGATAVLVRFGSPQIRLQTRCTLSDEDGTHSVASDSGPARRVLVLDGLTPGASVGLTLACEGIGSQPIQAQLTGPAYAKDIAISTGGASLTVDYGADSSVSSTVAGSCASGTCTATIPWQGRVPLYYRMTRSGRVGPVRVMMP